ncbi:SMI1/KNR4 family protein [Streptacidiphilus monticola]|uniref:SMI1/KNR4 family protein n=1 Tax=Streptacidiphilus monticola TaxID=2161674 RepID=A0ABW1G8K3_9ACTN
MHPAIERLAGMMPPPATRPSAAPWDLAPAEVGFQFPDDYRDFADLYGAGLVNDQLLIWTPSLKRDKVREGDARKGFASLVEGAPSGISDYLAELHEEEPEENPYPMYPDEEGLIAWGNDYSGNHFIWLTGDADPNKWPIISWNRSGYWFRFDGGFGDFLVANLTGEHPESTWIVGDERPPTWELVQDWSREY